MATVEVFARTEVGCARERNEDAFAVLSLTAGAEGQRPEQRVAPLAPPGVLVAVCDGMGGAAAGDVASRLAAQAVVDAGTAARSIDDEETAEGVLLDAVRRANDAILDYVDAHPRARGMGTTIVAAALFGPHAVIVNVGDSRAYLLRGRNLRPLTTDQSIVGQMLARGQITPEQVTSVAHKNVLLQAVGVQPTLAPELVRVSLMAGDALLLCSDGLHGTLDEERITEILLRRRDPMQACRALTEAACAAGAPDNVTVAVARFVGEGLFVPQGPAPVAIERREVTVGRGGGRR